jgi:aspartate beta-hydroxylase
MTDVRSVSRSVEEAQRLLSQGRVAEAQSAFANLLELDPGNAEALNFMALAALREGDLKKALALIEKALRRDAADPLTLYNHGRILDAAGLHDESITALRAALGVAPNLHAARLYLGHALERSGQTQKAVVAYARTLQDAQAEGRWLNPAGTPPAFRPLVEHAVRLVRQERLGTFTHLMEPLINRYGRDSMRRVEKSLRVYLKEETLPVPASGRRPTFFHFPDIPEQPYLDLSLFPWIDELEGDTELIREELRSLLPDSQGREAVFTSRELEADHLRGIDQPPSWNGYYFYRHGERRTENGERCSATAAALERLPLCKIKGHGPEVLFSVFTPGTHLLPHRGVTNVRVVGHLPLIVPDHCELVVGGESHCWRPGKVVVFDDTYEHEAWNRSKEIRVVLIFDVWNPYLTQAEREAIECIIEDIGLFRHEVERAS